MDRPSERARAALRAAFIKACILDVSVLKPGNVSLGNPAHAMVAMDFIVSAQVSACPLTDPSLAVGGRIHRAVTATREAVGCNTNLGIVLLSGPLLAAALGGGAKAGAQQLRAATAEVLSAMTSNDAAAVYRAIALASPGGLGTVEEADVGGPPPDSLIGAMRLAGDRDLVARQYAENFEDVFTVGYQAIATALDLGKPVPVAVRECYFAYLTRELDSHTLRRGGYEQAHWLRCRANEVASEMKACENPVEIDQQLGSFDRELKDAGINPGTTADLTVASILAHELAG